MLNFLRSLMRMLKFSLSLPPLVANTLHRHLHLSLLLVSSLQSHMKALIFPCILGHHKNKVNLRVLLVV